MSDEGLPPKPKWQERPVDLRQGDQAFAPESYAGIPGAPPVTDKGASSRALRPRKLSHRLKYLIQLAAMGCSQKEIAERAGYTPHRISVILNTPQVSNEVERARQHIFGRSAEQAMKTMLPKALQSIDDALGHDPTDWREKRDKAQLGFTLVEHTHGKAKQRIEASGNLLADLYAMMDQRSRDATERLQRSRGHTVVGDVQDAEYHEVEVEEPASPLDSFLDQALGEKSDERNKT